MDRTVSEHASTVIWRKVRKTAAPKSRRWTKERNDGIAPQGPFGVLSACRAHVRGTGMKRIASLSRRARSRNPRRARNRLQPGRGTGSGVETAATPDLDGLTQGQQPLSA